MISFLRVKMKAVLKPFFYDIHGIPTPATTKDAATMER